MLGVMRSAALIGTILAVAADASAAGVEDTVGGAVGLGRAAMFARVNDFLATWQNPANLGVLPGAELGAELRLSRFQACYDRAYDESVEYRRPNSEIGFRGTESVANICNDGRPGPGGNFGWAHSLAAGWGYGVGFFTPAAGSLGTRWGNETIVSLYPFDDEKYPPTLEGIEAPTRQMGIERRARFGGFLMAGLGWAPIPELRFGASAGVGALRVSATQVMSALKDTFLDQELLLEMTVTDYVIPRATAGLVLTPVDGFELFGVLTYQGDFHGQGEAEITANGIQGEPLADCRADDPGTHCRIGGVRLENRFPTFEITYGIRVAQRHAARTRTLDPVRDELWDLELDVSWAQTSHVDAVRVTLYDEATPMDERPRVQLSSSDDPSVSTYAPSAVNALPVRWRDTWTVRAGGDYNVLRGRLALRAGVSYATRAVPPEYMSITLWPVRKIGLHFGVTAVLGRYRLTLGYAHLFHESINVPVGSGKLTESAGVSMGMPLAINEGYYQASLDVVSLQLGAWF